MKKYIVFALCLLLCINIAVPALAAGENGQATETTCDVSTEMLQSGDEVTVVVSLANCEPIRSMGLTPTYDTNVFELVSGEWTASGALIANFDAEKGNAALAYLAATDINGDVFQFTLKVKESAPVGRTEIYAASIIKNANMKDVVCTDNTVEVEIVCSHSDKTEVPSKSADCINSGNNLYFVCDSCGVAFKADGVTETTVEAETIAALGHDLTDATCTETAKCLREGCDYVEGSALGHSFTNYVSNNDATCTEDGTKAAKCDRCEVTDTIADTGSAKGHDYADATCTAPKVCKVCGANEGNPLGHSYATTWSKGEDGHWHECSACGDKTDFAAHDYGDGDKCVACEYERTHIHRLTLVPAVGATCTTDGNVAYYACSGCENWFEDASGSIMISDKTSAVIAALGHDLTDATCTEAPHCKREGCEYTEGSALGHSFTNYVSSNDATCTEDGTKTAKCDRCDVTDTITDVGSAKGHDYADTTCTAPKTCKVCGVTEGDSLGHSFTNYVSNNDATCTEDGTKTAKCDRCDVTDTIVDAGSAKGHDHADATCTAPKTCKICGATEGDPLGHNYATTWSKGENGHWHECSACGDRADFAEHDYGTNGDICMVCEYERAHIHELTLVPAVDATCTENGNKAYYICSGCENWFEDAAGSIEISDKTSAVVAALGHDMTEATCTEAAHCQHEGCDYTEGAALGHADANADNKCDRCGVSMGNDRPITPDKPATDNPQTGDNSDVMMLTTLLMLSFVGMVACVFMGKKRNMA